MDMSLFKTRGSHHQWCGGRVVVCCGCRSTECSIGGGWWSNQRSNSSGSRKVFSGVAEVVVVVVVVGGIGSSHSRQKLQKEKASGIPG